MMYKVDAMFDSFSKAATALRVSVLFLALFCAQGFPSAAPAWAEPESGLTLDDLASAAHISKVYLGKCFVARYGQSPMRYLREIRMRHAADYLRERRPVGEVARLVGYADIFQFSRAFKQHFGTPPSHFGAD